MTEKCMCPEFESGVKTYDNYNMMSEYYNKQNRFHYNTNGIYYRDSKILKEFISEDILKITKGHYLAIVGINEKGQLIAKYGYTSVNIYDRYSNVTTARDMTKRMIRIWVTDINDKETIKDLRKTSKYPNSGFKTYEDVYGVKEKEMFVIEDEIGFFNFNDIIDQSHKKQNIGDGYESKKSILIYDSVKKTIEEVENLRKDGYNVVYADLCARFGKTPFSVELFKKSVERIMVLTSYVGTVGSSYMKLVKNYKSNEHIMILDPDKCKNMSDEIKSHLNKSPNNKIIIYAQLTGDNAENIKLFKKRIDCSLSYCKKYGSILVVEEADFGSKCSNQIKKLQYFCKHACPSFILVESGTNIESTYNIFTNSDKYNCYKSLIKNYIIDVLGDNSRENVVKINYTRLCNHNLLKNVDGYTPQEMENFGCFFSLKKDGSLKGKSYFEQLILFLFCTYMFTNNICDKKVKRCILDNKLINDKFATVIFVPEKGIRKYGNAFVELIKSIVGSEYEVCLITGDETTNKDAEEMAKNIIKNNWKKKGNNKVIFVMGSMGTRSWSVEEVKNIVLMLDGSGVSTLIQKISRGLTPVEEDHNKELQDNDICNIIDMRLDEIHGGHLNELLSGVARSSINRMDEMEVMKILCDTNKIQFFEYFGGDKTYPFIQMTNEYIRSVFRTKEYLRLRALSAINTDKFNDIPNPDDKYTGADDENSTGDLVQVIKLCTKGDNDKKVRIPKGDGSKNPTDINTPPEDDSDDNETKSNYISKSQEEVVNDRKKQHFYFLLNNVNIFNTYKYYGSDDWLYKEFDDIMNNDTIKKTISKHWNVDMDTIIGCVNLLKEINYNFFDL
jgi:hypothetical protein